MSSPSFFSKWGTYQAERFPLAAHGALILAFSASAVCFSSLLRGGQDPVTVRVLLVAFVSSFISFLHLRLADEFKDAEEDARYRPYRPVPRGLVTLRELGFLWIATGIIQALLACWLDPRLLIPLALTWLYLGLMSREFFARSWLKARPFTYMWTHMLIMPLVDLYATACEWLPHQPLPPSGLFWFLAASFFNGFVIELGRKIRSPEDEETGVETYSILWGRPRASGLWLLALLLTLACAVLAAIPIGHASWLALGGGAGVLWALRLRSNFLTSSPRGAGKRFETFAGCWTLGLYLGLGILPWLWRAAE